MRSCVSALMGLVLLMAGTGTAAEPVRKEKDKPTVEARLIVSDSGELFSPEAIKKAKAMMGEIKDKYPREMSILSYKEPPEAKKKEYDRIGKDDKTARAKFFRDWAVDEAKGEKAKGVFVFICRSPGHVHILVDKTIRDKGFTNRDEEQVRDLLTAKFREAKEAKEKDLSDEEQLALRDKGLLAAVEFVRDAYKKMVK